ncbi:MAG: hypothetical protein GHCLOJNM_00387 [bacterium]|nr:hypothetical protein [bacterium]
MPAVKAMFDGERVILPDGARSFPPGDVIVLFQAEEPSEEEEERLWLRIQSHSFAEIWDNDEDSVYDDL